MTHSGERLGVDLYNLWRIAKYQLPDLAESYACAANEVGATDQADSRAFGGPEADRATGGQVYVGGSRVYPYWKAIRDEFQKILRETSDNLTDTAQAIEMAIGLYVSTDETAAETLRSKIVHDQPVAASAVDGLRGLDLGTRGS